LCSDPQYQTEFMEPAAKTAAAFVHAHNSCCARVRSSAISSFTPLTALKNPLIEAVVMRSLWSSGRALQMRNNSSLSISTGLPSAACLIFSKCK
jgi:hypothetical protein